MNPKSATALSSVAGMLIVLGLLIPSPTGRFALLSLAVIVVAIPCIFAVKRARIISIILMTTALALTVSFYPEFKKDQDAYAKQVKERAAKKQADSNVPNQ